MSRGTARSFVGRRKRNEDAFAVRPELGLYVVADGMGGHAGGDVASRIVVDTMESFFERAGLSKSDDGPTLDEIELAQQRMGLAIRMCQSEVTRRATGDIADMGSTLAAILVRGRYAVIAHVGDSRIYRIREGRCELLTRDHSVCAELEAAGGGELVKRLSGSFGAMITRSISAGTNAKPDTRVEVTDLSDRFLICSDGVSNALDEDEMGEIVSQLDSASAADRLVERSFQAGSHDNITVVVIEAV
jgi:serine/threonine protein phosphatase PrpC